MWLSPGGFLSNRKTWTHLYETWRLEYIEEGLSIREIGRRHNANTMSVRTALRGLTRSYRVALEHPRYFERLNSSAKAYYFGLLVADGSINDLRGGERQWVLQIDLAQEDRVSPYGNERTVLERLRHELGSSATIGRYVKAKGPPGVVHKVSFCSNDLAMDLQMHGMFPRKSHDKIGIAPAGVPLKFLPDFARGLLDGDGGVELNVDQLPTGYVFWERRPYWDNALRVLEWMLAGFRQLGIVETNPIIRPDRETHRLKLAGRDAKRAIDAMYKNAGDLYLLRKWKRCHRHPYEWEDFDGDRSRIPPRKQERHKTGPKVGTTRQFDYQEIWRLRGEEQMTYKEIGRVIGCSRQVVLDALREQDELLDG